MPVFRVDAIKTRVAIEYHSIGKGWGQEVVTSAFVSVSILLVYAGGDGASNCRSDSVMPGSIFDSLPRNALGPRLASVFLVRCT